MQLVPIKVKIGLRNNGHADHPDWYQLPLAANVEPGTHMFYGWKYDKTSGHQESSPDSPIGMQWGMVFVTPTFAREAMSVFPDLVTEMTEADAEDFWDTKVYAHLPENKTDTNLLQALQAEVDLLNAIGTKPSAALITKIKNALDPTHVEPGITKDKEKVFADAKVRLELEVIGSQ